VEILNLVFFKQKLVQITKNKIQINFLEKDFLRISLPKGLRLKNYRNCKVVMYELHVSTLHYSECQKNTKKGGRYEKHSNGIKSSIGVKVILRTNI